LLLDAVALSANRAFFMDFAPIFPSNRDLSIEIQSGSDKKKIEI